MDLQRIKIILEKYYQGETTLDEEKILKEYFRQNNSLESSDPEKQLLNYYDSAKTSIPITLKKELNDIIDKEFEREPKQSSIKIIKWISSIAAILIVAIGIFFFKARNSEQLYKDTFKNQTEAYTETKQVLLFISSKMNSKTKSLRYLSNVDISLKQISKLSKIDKSLNSIKK
jgi:hypothetical protein